MSLAPTDLSVLPPRRDYWLRLQRAVLWKFVILFLPTLALALLTTAVLSHADWLSVPTTGKVLGALAGTAAVGLACMALLHLLGRCLLLAHRFRPREPEAAAFDYRQVWRRARSVLQVSLSEEGLEWLNNITPVDAQEGFMWWPLPERGLHRQGEAVLVLWVVVPAPYFSSPATAEAQLELRRAILGAIGRPVALGFVLPEDLPRDVRERLGYALHPLGGEVLP